ncbi:YdhR family protein [Daejeonella oryzae]|uniref:YdhR family protein n=1 Tax=Daejeonella oryzae TaxID=1122943 RepID=UPI00041A06A9|nr:YdhR family protein [Daejeonella oryzae]
MAQKILITNFNFSVSREEYEKTTAQLAQSFADVPGCIWKIWLINDETKEAGAVYLFKDEDSLQTFKTSPLVESVLSHPALSNFNFSERDILQDISEITHAPIMGSVAS